MQKAEARALSRRRRLLQGFAAANGILQPAAWETMAAIWRKPNADNGLWTIIAAKVRKSAGGVKGWETINFKCFTDKGLQRRHAFPDISFRAPMETMRT